MKKELITVIVPVYNVEKYLSRCVDSIINQTYSNLEIFLVDDGSPDKCGKICDDYAKKDQRIKVIHKQNGGLSDARNVALDVATGSYITFVDSDDYIALDMIENLYNDLKKYDAEIATCSYQSFYEKIENKGQVENKKTMVYNNEEALEDMLYQKSCTTSAWGKLYKKELFNKIRYPKGKICEDLDTTYLLFSKANKITISENKKYFYLQRKDSIINSKFNIKRMDALEFAEKETEYIKKYHKKIIKSAENREFMEAIFILDKLPQKKEYKKYRSKLKNTIQKLKSVVLLDTKSKRIYRFYALLSYFGTNTLLLALKIKVLLRRRKKYE